MYAEEYGEENNQILLMLHGAFFIHTFGRQYVLADKYHLIVPHIMGYGKHTDQTFITEKAVAELTDYIYGLKKPVTLIGFSLGAQLAYELVCRRTELLDRAIIISPWLLKTKAEMPKMLEMNEKQFFSMQNKMKCRMIAMMNGLPKEQRTEFVNQMQNVSMDTVRNSVDNGIIFDDRFSDVSIPVIALAGGREQPEIIESVKKMASVNSKCVCQIWSKAAHNIPPLFSTQLNKLIVEVMSR